LSSPEREPEVNDSTQDDRVPSRASKSDSDSPKKQSPIPRTPHEPEFTWSFLHPRYIGTWLLVGIVGIGFLMPNRWRYAFGGWIGDRFYKHNVKRRGIAKTNIDMCFPDLPESDREQMVKDHFKSYGRTVLDLGLIWWASESRLERLVHINGLEHLSEPIARGDSVILFTPHAAGLDLGGIMISRSVPTVSMMKALPNPIIDWLITSGRRRYKADVWLRDAGLRPLIKALKGNRVVYYMPDEDFGTRNSVFAPFFGVQTSTLTTLGRMAKMSGASVVPCFARILPNGEGYHVDIDPPMTNFPTGDDVQDATRMNEALADGISRAPAQYMWTLRWFKTRPDGEVPPYD